MNCIYVVLLRTYSGMDDRFLLCFEFKSREPPLVTSLPANIDAIKNNKAAVAVTITHHNITPTESLFLLYIKHTPELPHVPPVQRLHALSITLPTNTGPGIEPRRRSNTQLTPKANGRISSSTHLKFKTINIVELFPL